MLKNGAKTFTLVARYSTVFGTKKCYAFLVQENLRFSLHNKIYDFVCTNAKRKDRVLRKKSLEIFLRSLHPKNPRIGESGQTPHTKNCQSNFCAPEMPCIQRNAWAFLEQEILLEFLCFSGL